MALASGFIQSSQGLVETTGFLGLFIINMISSATIFLPIIPAVFITFAYASVANPILVGIVAGAGNAIGELTGYYIGVGGGKLIMKKNQRWLRRAKKWTEKRGPFAVILLFAATPLPSDIVGLLAGIIKYDVKKFLLAGFIGKTILNLVIAFAGFYGLNAILGYLGL